MYSITSSIPTREALCGISRRLAISSQSNLHLVSMKESFDSELLTRFYNELMIPNFPLEDERDDLDDWIYCLDPDQKQDLSRYPTMDVLILCQQQSNDNNNTVGDWNGSTCTSSVTILAGIAFEYYRNAQVGLLSYMVVADDFRQLGILRELHPVACHAMELLHQESIHKDSTVISPIKAILAETNTVDAGDVPPEVVRKRHEVLYRLGYRHLQFPYVQPPLAENGESFDDIMLLVHCGQDDKVTAMETDILYDYVVDFYQSVFGYDDDIKYKQHWYFELVEWFRIRRSKTNISQELPWEDVTTMLQSEMKESTGKRSNQAESSKHVVVVGAGIAGLVATVTLAEEYWKKVHELDDKDGQSAIRPLTISLLEAHPFVGGRIRTFVTDPAHCEEFKSVNASVAECDSVKNFSPWPVPVGAEFVHGVGSMINKLIEDHEDWIVQETFDLCVEPDEYPSKNSFVQRQNSLLLCPEQRQKSHIQLILDGQCHPILGKDDPTKSSRSGDVQIGRKVALMDRVNEIWQNLQYISEMMETGKVEDLPRDMSLEEYVNEKLNSCNDVVSNEDIQKIKQLLECMYANTAGTSLEHFGIHEASREENNWEYTECNWRTQHVFAEFIEYYISRIQKVNDESRELIQIKIETSCPVTEIGSSEESKEKCGSQLLRVQTKAGRTILCEKCIVTVPLSILKSRAIRFSDDFELPDKIQMAIDKIQMFSGMKAHLLWKIGMDIVSLTYRMETTEIFFCPGEIFSQVWLRRDDTSVFLTGFCVANCRDKLLGLVSGRGGEPKDQVAKSLFLDQLQRMFDSDNEQVFVNPQSPTCSAFALHDWSDDEYIQGVYSSPSVGAGWQDLEREGPTHPLRHYLAQPIKESLWLAGEHANVTTCASVQSAMESGDRAAKELLQTLSL
ncbi:amine oxidase [Nitzschia inconspicua]|uniref:Amine oxidase n=1 Tax=Nitzschia inconspicua TaxID=303405 RepID=A0A9K3L9S3_9STRA|nr:amine oxidase [Nitzschia inconspicua]KAG7357453.1 amine oxidase [Nitzschia inconspicua]